MKRKVEFMPVEINRPGVYLSITDSAQFLGVSRQAVDKAIRRGALEKIVTPWGNLINRDDLVAYRERKKNVE